MIIKSRWQEKYSEDYPATKCALATRFLGMIYDARAKIVKESSTTYLRYLDRVHPNTRKNIIRINKKDRTITYEGKNSTMYEVVGIDPYFDLIVDALESKIGM